jgi:polar amino acid transport system substrate-binding protein
MGRQDPHEALEIESQDLSRRTLFGRGTVLAATVAAIGTGAASIAIQDARAQAAAGSSKLQEVIKRGKLIVGTGTTNPPWHFEDETGKLVGMDIDMARLFAKGIFDDPSKIEFVRQAPDARIPNLVTNKIDIVCQFMTVTAGRSRQVEFTTPYYREGTGYILPKGSPHADYAALKKAGKAIKVAWLQNVFVEEWNAKALPEAQIQQYETSDAAMQAMLSGRADCAAQDLSTIRWLVTKFPDRYKDAGFGWVPNSYSFAVKPGDTIWLNFVNQMVKEAVSGVDFDDYAKSFATWFGETPPTPKIGYPA